MNEINTSEEEVPFVSHDHYDGRIDCNASCCWGCKDDHVEARVDGGSVCCSCLNKLIIRLAVCSVASSLPAQITCNRKNDSILQIG